MNNFIIIAALAKAMTPRSTQSGLSVVEFTLAGERRVCDHQGQQRNLPFYVRTEGLGKVADNLLARNYQPGDVLMVEGVGDYSTWKDKDDKSQSTVKLKVTGAVRKLDGIATHLDAGGNQRALGGLNRLTIIGNLAEDVEVKETAGGKFASLRVAVNEKYNTKSGEAAERTHWFNVSAWREAADAVSGLKKGQSIFVEGPLSEEAEWTDKDNNKRRGRKVIEAESIYPVVYAEGSSKPQADAPAGAGAAASADVPDMPEMSDDDIDNLF